MSNKHLKRTPCHLDNEIWYYEEFKGLVIVLGAGIKSGQHTISWRKIRAALKRKDRAEAEKGGENG
jgi:hypothetical protein